jgi:hypothetical protein
MAAAVANSRRLIGHSKSSADRIRAIPLIQ